jgi:tRNA(His) guanylyltransferase
VLKDSLGDRMKGYYEDAFRHILPRRTYAILRIDGKAFHTYTKKLPRPYCAELSACMDSAAIALCQSMQGVKLAYGQSDEYSFVFTDFDDIDTQMWFNGNVQKIVSVASSIFTAHFAQASHFLQAKYSVPTTAMFDARVFVISSRTDVMNYFVWRQQDAIRNSLSMLAACHFSSKELHGKDRISQYALLHNKGINWDKEPTAFQRGRVIRRQFVPRDVSYVHRLTKERITNNIVEPKWAVDEEIPLFKDNHAYLGGLIPDYEPTKATEAATV